MRLHHALLCALLTFTAAPLYAQDDGGVSKGDAKEKPKREIDTDSPEAMALKEVLHVEPNYGKDDKRVELLYLFNEPSHLEDFEHQGFDRTDTNYRLELGVGSQRQGLILHNLNMSDDDFEVEIDAILEWIAPSSQLVFVFGNGKSGAIWGCMLGKRGSGGYKPVSRGARDVRDQFNGARLVNLRFVCKDGAITSYVNGVKTDETKKLNGKLAGRVGIFLTNMRLAISKFSIKGAIDASKL